jgi:hypothetical protein
MHGADESIARGTQAVRDTHTLYAAANAFVAKEAAFRALRHELERDLRLAEQRLMQGLCRNMP